MRRMLVALARVFRRWKYVEEDPATASASATAEPAADGERLRTSRAIERAERLLADYRRNGCTALARECEISLRALRTHLAALDF